MARWRAKYAPQPTQEALNPLLRQDHVHQHEEDDYEDEKCQTPTPHKRVQDIDRDMVPPERLFRGKSPWKAPVPLPPCPFSAENPCCRKGVPCYRYFESDIPVWRRGHLYDSTENDEVTRERLVAHRLENKLPDGKTYCVAFQTYWSGWSRAKICPGQNCPSSNQNDSP